MSADELEHGLVEATPDLILMFLPEDLMLAGGGEVRLAYTIMAP